VQNKLSEDMKLRIGEVAEQAGVNVQTLRYYERVGLLEKPDREESGYRSYSRKTIDQVRLIKSAQALGYSLKEIEDLVRLCSVDGRDREACFAAFALAQERLKEINEKIESLRTLKASLEAIIAPCQCDPRSCG
jgi:DNA-binding transcriptional MerR regulator